MRADEIGGRGVRGKQIATEKPEQLPVIFFVKSRSFRNFLNLGRARGIRKNESRHLFELGDTIFNFQLSSLDQAFFFGDQPENFDEKIPLSQGSSSNLCLI
jgi:hypothetical protein